jgi:hypothetical protein
MKNFSVDLLTLPKLSFGLFLLLMMIGSLLTQSHPFRALAHDWFDVIFTTGVIFYLFKTLLHPGRMCEKMPLSSFILFLLSFYLLYTDLRILFHLINADFSIVKRVQLSMMIWAYYLVPLFSVTSLIDLGIYAQK